jgi:hypothetical protein
MGSRLSFLVHRHLTLTDLLAVSKEKIAAEEAAAQDDRPIAARRAFRIGRFAARSPPRRIG